MGTPKENKPERSTNPADDKADAPELAPRQVGKEFKVVMARPKQVGEAMLGAGECVAVISCHPQCDPNYVVDAIRGGVCTVVPVL